VRALTEGRGADFAIRGRDVRGCQNGRVRMRRDIPRFVRMLEGGLVDGADHQLA
jgi:hypothetical protein